MIALGGNNKFEEFMENYDLNYLPAIIKYRTIAAQYYRNYVNIIDNYS